MIEQKQLHQHACLRITKNGWSQSPILGIEKAPQLHTSSHCFKQRQWLDVYSISHFLSEMYESCMKGLLTRNHRSLCPNAGREFTPNATSQKCA